MSDFKLKNGEFARRTRRRVLAEVLVLALITIYLASSWSSRIPSWVEWSVIVLFVGYIAFGLLMYRKSKAIADSFAVSLSEDGLAFFDGTASRQLAYRDLQISKVKKEKDEIAEIWLETSFRQVIKLKGFENMRELHERLTTHLPKR